MTIRFETLSGSLYEVDDEASKVRRLIGVSDPTPRQGKDGEWKAFTTRTPIVLNQGVSFIWAIVGGDTNPGVIGLTAQSTVTSPIKKILEDSAN